MSTFIVNSPRRTIFEDMWGDTIEHPPAPPPHPKIPGDEIIGVLLIGGPRSNEVAKVGDVDRIDVGAAHPYLARWWKFRHAAGFYMYPFYIYPGTDERYVEDMVRSAIHSRRFESMYFHVGEKDFE